jgi:putative membrane protein
VSKLKKNIIIEEENLEKTSVKDKIIEWLIYMVGYALVLIIVSVIFKKSFYINNKYFGLYALLAAIIISILNQTIKPVLVYLTLPLTAITLGLFYPIINVLILYITSFILGNNFEVHGIITFVIAILISLLNIFVEGLIIKPIIHRKKVNHE